MAATAWLFDYAPEFWIDGATAVDFESNSNLKVALLNAVPAQSAANWSAISSTEVTGTNYTAGGQAITSAAVATSGHVCSVGWANVTWSSSTITAKAAVLYDTGTGAVHLCVNLNAGADVSSSSGDFTISWTSVSNIAWTVTVATAT